MNVATVKKTSWNAHFFAIRVRHGPLSACA